MNRFQIRWGRTALGELADAWTRASDRSAVNSAAAEIERKLRENPTGFADGQVEGLYFLAEAPLRVGYTIDNASKTVTVVGFGVSHSR